MLDLAEFAQVESGDFLDLLALATVGLDLGVELLVELLQPKHRLLVVLGGQRQVLEAAVVALDLLHRLVVVSLLRLQVSLEIVDLMETKR